MRRELPGGYELDDEPARVDVGEVHRFLSEESYVHPDARRRTRVELVQELVENGPHRDVGWLLHTTDAHELYVRFGFAEPTEKVLERRKGAPAPPAEPRTKLLRAI